MSYPQGFHDWPLDRRNEYYAKEERERRARTPNGNGNAKFLESDERPAVITLTRASDIKPEPISWLWKYWFARGKLHILAGQPGVGKSTVAMKIAAAVSAGGRWPDGSTAKQGNVVIWSGEDDVKDTLAPHLEASGADGSHVFFVSGFAKGEERRPFDPAKDIPALLAAIKEADGAALIIIDPIVSATTADSHKNSETRRGLQPPLDMASELDAALLGITHFTKGSEGRSPIDRVTGSLAFGALARVVMVAAKQQGGEDGKPGSRILMRAKSNIGPDDGGFNYELQLTTLYDRPDIEASVVSWGDPVAGNAREILAEAEAVKGDDDESNALSEAKDFLLDFLMDGPSPAKVAQKAASDAGHYPRTIKRAKAELNISSVKRDGGWVWALPQGGQQSGKVANPKNMAPLAPLAPFKENQWVTNAANTQKNQGGQGGHVFGVGHLGPLEADGDGLEGEI